MRNEPIDPATLAALLDGTMRRDERERVLAKLARSEESYEDFIEASAILNELADESGGRGPLSGLEQTPTAGRPRANRWHRTVLGFGVPALAAAAIAAVMFTRQGPERAAERVVAVARGVLPAAGARGAGQATLGPDWDRPAWSSMRGAGDRLSTTARAFRMGARVAQLELAVAAQDSAAIGRLSRALELLASEVETGAPVAARAAHLAATRGGAQAAERTRVAAELRTLVGAPEWFDLGVWSESARLAARARQVSFFSPDGPAMQELGRLLAAFGRLDAGERRHAEPTLDRLRRLAGTTISTPDDLRPVAAALDSTVAEGGR